MTKIFDLHLGVTESQKKSAMKVAAILRSRGFEADDLDEVVLRVAEKLGESAIDADAGADVDQSVDAELTAADEINMSSMDNQLEVLSAYHKTEGEFFNAIESALSISLISEHGPLV